MSTDDKPLPKLTRRPQVHGSIGQLQTSRGDVTIALTDNPTDLMPDHFKTFVALGRWRPKDQPVVMFITFAISEDKATRHINLVFAPPDVRYQARLDKGESVSDRVGKWLFDQGALTHHSADRTPDGDKWAHRVGGIIPPLLAEDDKARGNPAATLQTAQRAYQALCLTEWGDLMETPPDDDSGSPRKGETGES